MRTAVGYSRAIASDLPALPVSDADAPLRRRPGGARHRRRPRALPARADAREGPGVLRRAATHYGTDWPIRYRTSEPDRVATLAALGVRTYAPLVYPHKPGMGRWLTEWVGEFAARTPAAVPTATLFPEPDVADYFGAADDRLGVPFLRAVLHDNPARLLRLATD